MPATLLLASVNSVNSVNSNHIGRCLLAITRSNTLNIAVNHRLISYAVVRCADVWLKLCLHHIDHRSEIAIAGETVAIKYMCVGQ